MENNRYIYNLIMTNLMVEIIASVVMGLFLVWSIVINWRILKKAGQPGWKALIPIYDVITINRAIGSSMGSLVIYGILMAGCVLLYVLGMGLPTLLLIIYYMSLDYRIAKFFGKSTGFAIGAALLWPIFGGILAFSKDVSVNDAEPRDAAPANTVDTPEKVPAIEEKPSEAAQPDEPEKKPGQPPVQPNFFAQNTQANPFKNPFKDQGQS